eukprot:TRINITY_DN35864_c0_g1_i1.p1 TRINITY_DN35864_c0_g1~~TRINITY_DN35864_c0_g1_i1.p1  ORF type:complete len:212 (-),score=49.41 TRINITY_DN35864_c0_g1_i1:80-664(-)
MTGMGACGMTSMDGLGMNACSGCGMGATGFGMGCGCGKVASTPSPKEIEEMEMEKQRQDIMKQNMLMMQQMMKMQEMMKSGKSSSSSSKAKAAPEDDDVPPGPSTNLNHPNYRPPDSETIPGVTDKRFEGNLKMWFDDKGYGFIDNAELKEKFSGMDVFLHLNQKRHFVRGDSVSFGIFKNYRGQPQATELRRS